MKKEEYLERIKYYLDERDFSEEEIEEILEDYEMMIDEALDSNPNEEDFDTLLGNPREIVRNLNKKVVIKRVKNNRFLALTPFLSTIIFFALGFGFGLWTYGWLAFLLVPITGALSSRSKSRLKNVLELTPFIALIVFLVVGLTTDTWHPTWMIFLLVPAVGILERKQAHYWLWFLYFISVPIVYLLSIYFFPFEYNWLILLLLVVTGLKTGFINVRINGLRNSKLEGILLMTIVLATGSYILIGLYAEAWHPGWLVFLSIPVVAIISSTRFFNNRIPIIAIMPFIALILFFIGGEYFIGYQWSWMFFFLIPIVAILTGSRRHKRKGNLVAIMPFIAVICFFLAGELLEGYQWSWMFFFLIPMTAIMTKGK